MCNDVGRDDNAAARFVSKLYVILKKVDEKSSKNTTDPKKHVARKPIRQANGKCKEKGVETTIEIGRDSLKSKLKDERENLVRYFYNIIDSTPVARRCIPESNPTHYVNNSYENESNLEAELWLDTYDYDLEFRGCKTSTFGPRKRNRSMPKTRGNISSKQQKKTFRNGFYNTRKREFDLNRRAESKEKLKT